MLRTWTLVGLFPLVLSCVPGFHHMPSISKCVSMSNASDYLSASLACQSSFGGHLISVTNGFINAQLAGFGLEDDIASRMYLGGDNFRKHTYSWIDGSNMSYTNWASGQPSSDPESCITMDISNGLWYSASCDTVLPYICAMNDGCSTGWSPHNGNCYKYFSVFSDDVMSVQDDYCVTLGGHLASIHDDAENDFIVALTPNDTCHWPFIGLQCSSNVYSWTDGTAVDYKNTTVCSQSYWIGNRACGPRTGYWDYADNIVWHQFVCKKFV